jgi:hypothetical protein
MTYMPSGGPWIALIEESDQVGEGRWQVSGVLHPWLGAPLIWRHRVTRGLDGQAYNATDWQLPVTLTTIARSERCVFKQPACWPRRNYERNSLADVGFSSGGQGSLSAGYEGRDHVGGVAIEVLTAPVVAGGGPGIGMPGSDLHVSQRHASVQAGGDEAVAKRVPGRCAW